MSAPMRCFRPSTLACVGLNVAKEQSKKAYKAPSFERTDKSSRRVQSFTNEGWVNASHVDVALANTRTTPQTKNNFRDIYDATE